MQSIINVANRLPVTVGDTLKKSSGGLVSALEGVSGDQFKLHWIGWPGKAFTDPAEQESVRRRLGDELGYVPVFLSDDEIRLYYHGLSNSSLWPILHYNLNFMRYAEEEWEAYEQVNRRFADAILEKAGQNDIVWVHDYHLMLVPAMLRSSRPDLRIGFFFHTPFPSSEVFRCHPRRSELLEGVIGADLVGFHTFGYMRHFRSSVLRLLGLESEWGTILHGNHLTSLGVFPIGINAQSFTKELESEPFHKKKGEIARNWHGKRIVLSVERLDYTKGILHRLDAIELFLSRREHADDIVFIFVSVPSRGEVAEYKSLRENIEREVGRINGLYATVRNSPIHFIHQSLPFTELCALYSLADVALITPLVDGMNLVAKEYVACQRFNPGVLILSEFAGAAQELVNAMSVNPYDTAEVADALEQAFRMPLSERRHRIEYMQARVLKFDANHWAQSFLNELQEQSQFHASPQQLEEAEDAIIGRLRRANKVAFFIDYDGTLREFERIPDRAVPGKKLKPLLEELNAASADVFIISGRKGPILDDWFRGYEFTLIAEHGSNVRIAGEKDWFSLNQSTDFSWKRRVLDILRHYEWSTPGSFVEEKESALVWHYRQSDPEFGQWKARQLLSELYEMLANFPVEIHHGKKIIEVSSIHVNKGAAIEHFLREREYDLAICAGDDQTDEAMFRIDHPVLLRIKVGEGDTRADYRIPDPHHFRQLLRRMIGALKDARQTA